MPQDKLHKTPTSRAAPGKRHLFSVTDVDIRLDIYFFKESNNIQGNTLAVTEPGWNT